MRELRLLLPRRLPLSGTWETRMIDAFTAAGAESADGRGSALIAMSGGVDSSVAAYLMKTAGYDCIGVTMRLFNNEGAVLPGEKSCCSLEDTEDARSVAYRLGIPYYVFNFTGDFRREVIDRFIAAYEEGRTPNPCIDCNRYMKFGRLYQRAAELGCGTIVTGHYARIGNDGGRFLLLKAADPAKDQSYFLYSLTQEQLSHTMFPLGDMTKEETRRIAEDQGFINAKKRDSQDICFVPDQDYAAVIARYTGKNYPRGSFVDTAGRVLGEHKGIIHYTIGQRKGLGLALPEPLYVKGKDIVKNEVILACADELFLSSLDAGDFNWIACPPPTAPMRVRAKTRYKQEEIPAVVHTTGERTVRVEFDRPVRAISPGQAVVLYDGDVVVGGGTIG